MGKKILAVYFSQSGQTRAIVESFLRPVVTDGSEVEYLQIKTVHQFPFPWSVPVFFDTVPESVNIIPTTLEPWQTKLERYDLVILGWQPWNLSPSIPFNSILQDEKFKALIKGTPVITISGCRNMWINAQEKNKKLLQAAGARLVGNIALVDRHLNHLSYFTIFHWLGTGRKDRKWGIFPKPGVSEKDISGASKFGNVVNNYLRLNNWEGLQQDLSQIGATPVKYSLMFIERKAGKIFQKWVDLINKFPQKRKNILVVYKYYLAVALLVASPIILAVDFVLFRPFSQKKIRRQMQYYKGVEYRERI
ncbi:hypothetical protein ACTJIJ_06800 [Niabella sp. 22666]|uniref:hypothetical protein n=1 Tax=Niabella sp. 22666 TaxID=3453954 RepID=UPI003F874C7C